MRTRGLATAFFLAMLGLADAQTPTPTATPLPGCIGHRFVSPVADAGDPNEVGPDEWNDCLTMTGGEAGNIPLRDPTATDGWRWATPVPGGGGGTFSPYDEATPLPTRSAFNCTGDLISCSDDAGNSRTTIAIANPTPGGGGSLAIGSTAISGGGAGRLLMDDPSSPGTLQARAGLAWEDPGQLNISGANSGGGDVYSIALNISNTSTGPNAAAVLALHVATASGDADPYILFTRGGTAQRWSFGVDTSNSDAMTLASGEFLGGSHQLEVTTGGLWKFAASGSNSAPLFSLIGDPDTGIYFPASNQVQIATGGVAAALFSAHAIQLEQSYANNPVFVNIGNSSNTSGAGAILELYSGGTSALDPVLGFRVLGSTSWSLGTDTSDGRKFKLSQTTDAVGTNDTLIVDTGGHVQWKNAASGGASVGGSCGSGPSISGSDTAGKVTTGTGSPTSCTVTFANAWPVAPACAATNETTANLLRATSTTTTVVLAGTLSAGDVLSYQCVGY
jgi:hypothetical protein